MSVYRVIDIIGTSAESWEDAAKTAITTASGTVRDLRVARVVDQDLDIDPSGGITFRVKLELSFKYEEGG
jgi:dodecin